jgi:hypothetical protein
MNSHDDQDPSVSGDDRDWLEAELTELQQEGFATKRISAAQKAEMLRIQDEVGYSSLLDLLSEHFPDILRAKGKKQKNDEDRDYRKARQAGEFAPLVTVEGVGQRSVTDPPATPKQIAYLRDLGVRDEALLSRLGKNQASAVIEKALDARDKAFSAPQQKSGCLGVLLFSFFVGGILWIVFR